MIYCFLIFDLNFFCLRLKTTYLKIDYRTRIRTLRKKLKLGRESDSSSDEEDDVDPMDLSFIYKKHRQDDSDTDDDDDNDPGLGGQQGMEVVA